MRIEVSPSGETACLPLKGDLSYGGEDRATVTVWETVVFEKIEGVWKLVHGHVSRPVVP